MLIYLTYMYISKMFCMIFGILLLFGFNIFTGVKGEIPKNEALLKYMDILEFTNETNGNHHGKIKQTKQELFYNPVLQNSSSLSIYLNSLRRKTGDSNDKLSRKKRSRSRNCSGQCENSLCPWREVWDEERTRVPQFIKYAVCDSPMCDFAAVGLSLASSFIPIMRTHCDLVKIDIQVSEDGQEKWLTDWPIACVCTQRNINSDVALQFAHPGRHSDQVDVDITSNASLEPVSRQQILLGESRDRSLSRGQRRRLRNQHRNMHNTESWEEMIQRKYRDRA